MLNLRPISQKEAFPFIRDHHRHHNVPAGWLWGHAVEDGAGQLVGVAVVGRPIARQLDDDYTCEVTRLCTDGTANTCSILYAAAWRAAQPKGYRRILTYILETEEGASLRAAGWAVLGKTKGESWDRPSRHRSDPNPTVVKIKYGLGAWRALAEAA